jgi:protein SCO1/2
MQSPSRSLQVVVWGMVVLTMLAIAAAYLLQEMRRTRKPAIVDGIQMLESPKELPRELPVLFQVPEFALTNQSGELIRSSDLRGKVWIADIIFTQCAGPCPSMTRRMAELQQVIPPQSPVRFVTLTAHPEHDTPAVLARYADRYLASPGRWHFLTGTKPQIVDAAVNGLKLTAIEKETLQRTDPNDLFIHSTIFVVVDKQGRARAVLESDDEAMKVRALGIVQMLLDEK